MPKRAATLVVALGALVASCALYPTISRGQEANPLSGSPSFPSPSEISPLPASDPAPTVPVPAAPSPLAGDGEVRAMWVVRDAMTSPQKIRNTMALAKKYRFNTVFVQVRGRGDAFYDSRYEPRSEALRGQPGTFDPLAVAVAEGHRAGLQVHAWLNTFFVWHQKRRPYAMQHVLNRHPEWLVRDRAGRTTWTERKDCEGAFLNPALPGVREHTRNVFVDVASRYAVDGIHFDYVRFPSEDYSFSDEDLAQFRAYLLPTLTPGQIAYADAKRAQNRLAWFYCFKPEWRAWRQSLVTETVRSIADEARRARPGIIVSAAVFPNYGVATGDKGQAWRDWLRTGILDAACPMAYNRSTPLVAAQIRDAVRHASGRPIIAGVGAWQMPAASAIAKVRAFRSLGVAGMNFFSYNGMTREGRTEAYLAKVRGALFPNVVATPNWRRPLTTAQGGGRGKADHATLRNDRSPGG